MPVAEHTSRPSYSWKIRKYQSLEETFFTNGEAKGDQIFTIRSNHGDFRIVASKLWILEMKPGAESFGLDELIAYDDREAFFEKNVQRAIKLNLT